MTSIVETQGGDTTMGKLKNHRLIGVGVAVVMCCGLGLLSLCGMPPHVGAENPPAAKEHAADEPLAGEEASRSATQVDPNIPFYQQVDYERLPQGYDPEDPALPFLDLCNEEFKEIYKRYGMALNSGTSISGGIYELPSWACYGSDEELSLDEYMIVNEPDEKELIRDVMGKFLGEAHDSWIPGAYYVNYDISDDANENCQIAVDTPRGRLGMTHIGLANRNRVAEHCRLAREKLEDLYRDREFLIAVYGEDLPRKHR